MIKKLTDKEAQAIRLVHHDFIGRSRKDAAAYMKITEQRLSQLLCSAKKKAPYLFPILTQNQNIVHVAIVEHGQDRENIAWAFDWPIKKVDNIIAQLRKKGISLTVPKTVRYETHMDNKVVRKF